MDKEKLQFRSDASVDASSVIIEDYAGDQMVKIYPYFLPNTTRGNEFIQSNSTTLMTYSQFDLEGEELKTDENGIKYFEIIPSLTTSTQAIANAGINQFADELTEVKVFSALSNYWPKKVRKNLTIGKLNLIPMMFTIGRPLSEADWKANKQPVFITSNCVVAKDSESDLSYEVVEDGIVEATFVNLFTLTQQYDNCAIQFTNYDLTKVKTMGIILPSNSFFGGAYGRSLIDGYLEDVSLSEPKHYPIWNSVPLSVDNKLEMFMKWADTKMVLPIHIIQKFKTEQPLSTLFKDDANAYLPDGEALYTLLKDMILYTQMYVNGWNDIQAQDKLADPTNSNYGTIKINVTVGSTSAPATYTAGKKVINLIVGKQPAEIIETLYESFLRENPTVNQNTLAIFKGAVVALSRYIRAGNLALGGGLNDFNSIYLPWRLKLANKVNITRTPDTGGTDVNYSLKEDPQVAFDSHWYEYDGDVLRAKTIQNLYETQLIQSERNITQPLIPMELDAISLSSNPGGVNINSDNELRYNWLIPTADQKVIETLLLKDLNVIITDPVEQILNDRTIRITDENTLLVINELDTLLQGIVLAPTYADETDAVKKIIQDWYVSKGFFGAFALMGAVEKTKVDIITATGFNKDELVSFGVAGADWLVAPDDPYRIVWDFMKVIRTGFDRTTFETINHKDQWNGEQFTTNAENIINYPLQNWMREIKASWLNKYLDNEVGLEGLLKSKGLEILHNMSGSGWSTSSLNLTQAEFETYFPTLKGNMTFGQFKLTINGTLNDLVRKSSTPPGTIGAGDGRVIVMPANGAYYWWLAGTDLSDSQAILNVEIVEQIPIIYPNAVHYKLKSGTVQSFDLGTNRKLIFTKDEWQNLMRAIKPASHFETVDLKPIRGEELGEIKELDVFLLWASKISLVLDGINIELDSINDYDEKIVKQKIIFT